MLDRVIEELECDKSLHLVLDVPIDAQHLIYLLRVELNLVDLEVKNVFKRQHIGGVTHDRKFGHGVVDTRHICTIFSADLCLQAGDTVDVHLVKGAICLHLLLVLFDVLLVAFYFFIQLAHVLFVNIDGVTKHELRLFKFD